MTYGVIDMGSNTVRLCIYEIQNGRIHSLLSSKTTAGLIGYAEDGRLSEDGIDKACEVLSEYRDMAERIRVKKLYVFATASLRNIDNTEEAVAAINKATGLDVDVLSGRDEAILDFTGAAHARSLEDGLMVDIGGGSTELVTFEGGKLSDVTSLPFGSLSMYRSRVSHFFPDKGERKEIHRITEDALRGTDFLIKGGYSDMVGIGGTIRSVKKYHNARYGCSKDNDKIPVERMNEILHELKGDEKSIFNKILKVAPDRVHTLLPGMLILEVICEYCGCREITMSSFGVREGYLYEKVCMRR